MIELLVIIGIVSILSSIMFIDYGKNGKQFALSRSAQKLSQDLRRTQEMAMSALSGDASTNGYGIYFNKGTGNETQYIIYRNDNENMYYEAGTDSIKETIIIEDGLKICDILDNGVSEVDNIISVSFEPPDPITYIESNYAGHEASIKLCVISNESQFKTIKINNTGRIEITD